MSILPTITVKGYKSFKDETEFKLKPLTLLYGKNQGGKSSFLRLLPLLASSLQPGTPLLDMFSSALRGTNLKELGWLGKNPERPKLKISADDIFYKIFIEGSPDPYANMIDIGKKGESDSFMVSLSEEAEINSNQITAKYKNLDKGTEFEDILTFSSFLVSKNNLPEKTKNYLDHIEDSLKSLKRIQWFHANRLSKIKTENSSFNEKIMCCSSSGDNLVKILSQKNKIIEKVSTWLMQEDILGEKLSIDTDSQGNNHFHLRRSGHEKRDLHLAGEGIRSMLPLVLSASWAEAKSSDSPTMIAAEEPESHLHPNLQIELFNRLLETVKAGIPVILETHSVYILRALQLAILENKIQTDKVGLYWMEQNEEGSATATHIQINENATMPNWQPGTFEEEQELARQIHHKQWNLKENF